MQRWTVWYGVEQHAKVTASLYWHTAARNGLMWCRNIHSWSARGHKYGLTFVGADPRYASEMFIFCTCQVIFMASVGLDGNNKTGFLFYSLWINLKYLTRGSNWFKITCYCSGLNITAVSFWDMAISHIAQRWLANAFQMLGSFIFHAGDIFSQSAGFHCSRR